MSTQRYKIKIKKLNSRLFLRCQSAVRNILITAGHKSLTQRDQHSPTVTRIEGILYLCGRVCGLSP